MIRRACRDDEARIRHVAEAAYQPYVARIGKPPAPMVADFATHIDRDWVIVFDTERVVAGYAILIAGDEQALLDNIAVDPAFQRSGIGLALLNETERHAALLGHTYLDLYTNILMTDNIRWYAKLGFAETKRIEEKGFRRVYMKKPLSSES